MFPGHRTLVFNETANHVMDQGTQPLPAVSTTSQNNILKL